MKLSELRALSQKEIDLVHESSLQILETVGLTVDSDAVLDLLEAGGCKVERNIRRVRFPRDVVQRSLTTLPERIPLFDRDGRKALTLGDGGRYCASGHNAVFMVEDDTGERRNSTVSDVEKFSVLSDALTAVDIVGVPVMPQDTPAQTTLVHAVKAILENTKKPIFYSSESDLVNQAIIAMGKAVLGRDSLQGCSNLISQLSTTSPLFWERGAVEALCTVAREGIPVTFLPQPIAGVTAPFTLAGILTLHNAEVLSGIVVTQLVNAGTPVIYGAAWTTYELKQINVLIGRPESSLLRIAGAQMAHFYKVPSHTTAPDTDSNRLDEQNAWEKMLSTVAGLVGANDFIVNLGMFGTGMSIAFEQLVLDDEMCRIVKRFVQGIEVTPETIAVEIIANVGPRGNSLMEDHTLDRLGGDEHAELTLSNAAPFEIWRTHGARSVVENARAKASAILAEGCRCPLDASKKKELDEILQQYEMLIIGKGK
jgi:trimethylamine--corrinoid protein Co-methyltransferase